jgi:hypothetical protein
LNNNKKFGGYEDIELTEKKEKIENLLNDKEYFQNEKVIFSGT